MTGWEALARELDRWGAARRAATFWWRDDDAAAETEALSRLLRLRAAVRVPLSLAVIPARAAAGLARALPDDGAVAVLQHGWDHVDHHPDPRRKAELASDREPGPLVRDLAAGRSRLEALFGDASLPILVPPWNRIDAALVGLLPGLGYAGLSTFAPRPGPEAAPALALVNTHVDIVDWRGTRGFVGEDAALAAAVGHLAARRTGAADADEPTGLLSHHAAHDDGCWTFVDAFLTRTRDHPAARWLSAREAFALPR